MRIDIWVRLHVHQASNIGAQGKIECVTTGLAAFVGRVIEFAHVALHPGIIAQCVQGTILYVLAQGMVLKTGDTLGISETERIRIEQADAGLRPGVPIIRLVPETLMPQAN